MLAKQFDSFDFSTLYTNIPYDLLLNSIGELITEAYCWNLLFVIIPYVCYVIFQFW